MNYDKYVFKKNDKFDKCFIGIVLGGPFMIPNRCDKAIELYKNKKIKYILVSGGLGYFSKYKRIKRIAEAKAMRDYLIKNKIPKDKIILEFHSRNTLENAINSREIIKKKFSEDIDICLITSEFHSMRSYLLFKNIFKKAKIYSCSVKDKYFDKNVYNSSIIGKATNSASVGAEETRLTAVNVTNAELKLAITAKTDGMVNFENIAVGGMFGMLEGVKVNNRFFIDNVNLDSTSKLIFVNNGVYASSRYTNKGNISVGGIVGQFGGNSNGFIEFNAVTNNTAIPVSYSHLNTKTYIANSTSISNVNIGSVMGSVLSCGGSINNATCDATLDWRLEEADKVIVNIGGVVGRLCQGEILNIFSNSAIQSQSANPVKLGKDTVLNIGGLVGRLQGGKITQTGYLANIVVTLKADSYSSINMGGLVGYYEIATDSNIIRSFASGLLRLNTKAESQKDANIGGLVGYAYNGVVLTDCYSSNDIYTYIYDGNTETIKSNYNTIGGVVGTLEIANLSTDDVKMDRVYSISNIIASKAINENFAIGGIIGKVISQDGTDIEYILNLKNVYYLAEFFIYNNSIGTGLSVEEMLFDNVDYFSSWGTAWKTTRESGDTYNNWVFPRLAWAGSKDAQYANSFIPTIVTDMDSATWSTINYAIVTDKNGSSTPMSISDVDVFFHTTEESDWLNDNITLFDEVGNNIAKAYKGKFHDLETIGAVELATTIKSIWY